MTTVLKSTSANRLSSLSSKFSSFALWLCLTVTALVCGPAVQAQATRFAGSTPVSTSGGTLPVTVTLSSAGAVGSIQVLTGGVRGLDFAAATGGSCSASATYTAGQSCTVNVSFTPTAPGERRGAVVLLSSQGNVLGRQFVAGTATGALGVFIPGTVNTVAGDFLWVYGGDNVPANQTSLFLPFGVTVDAAGNVFLSDTNNNRIRKVAAGTSIITTIAGTGTIGSTGDGGPATAATVNTPTSVALDPAGNIYFSDNGNNVVRRIDAFTGVITTVAGTLGTPGYTGDGGAATQATLNQPNGLSFDASGNLYIADTGNDVIRLVSVATGTISTVAGKGGVASYTGDGGQAASATLYGPRGVTAVATGELYIADQNNNVIRKVSASGVISTIVGTSTPGFLGDGGLASQAELSLPASVALDVAGNMYVGDSGNNRVRKVNVATGVITTIAGESSQSIMGDGLPATSDGLYGPYDLALDGSGSLYIADVFHNRIRKVSANAASLLYPAMRVSRVSTPESQTIENDGNAPLTVTGFTSVTNSAVDAGSTTCSSSTPLAVLGQCILGASFAPTAIGNPVFGTMNVSSNALNSPGVLTLQGQVLTIDPTTVTLTSSANPSNVGASVIFSVIASSAGTTPTGTVTLLDGTATLGTATLVSGSANFNIATLAAGTHSITASYGGDTSNTSGVSAVLTQVVKDPVAATKTTISSSANPAVAGAALTLTSTVTVAVAGAGTGTISGSVSFYDGATLVGSGTVNNGNATASVTSLGVGSHALSAVYSGNSNYATSTSGSLSENVTIASSGIALSTNANPSAAGAPLTLTAAITTTGGIATGTVTFYDGATTLGTGTLNAGGSATLVVQGTNWTVGTHTLTAVYGGDAKDTAITSAAVKQIVNLATTTVSVNTSASPIGQGGAITFTATVKGNGGTPTGTVSFYDGATLLGTGTTSIDGIATLNTATLALGSHSITAVYGGDASDNGSTSPALTQVVQSASTTTTLASSKNPSNYGSSLVLTAVVSGTGSVPTGNVIFTDGATVLATIAVDGTGTATYATSTLAIGSHTLTAKYQGDANHSATNSSPLTQSIVQGTTTTLTASTTQSFAGSPVTWTVTVTGANGQATTGSVSIMDGAALLATVTPDATGRAVFTSASLKAGTHTMVATFAGDATDAASTSNTVVNIVSIATTTTVLTSSLNPAFTGVAVTFHATIAGNGGAPTGSVSFLDGSKVLATVAATPDASGATAQATLTVSTLAPGVHNMTAQYSGDTNDNGSVSAAVSQQIVQQTSLSLASSANPSLLTDSVTITATVSNGTATPPTGNVVLTDGGATIGTAVIGTNGVASFTLTSPALGTHALVATYAGDAQNTAATPATLTQTVVLRPTTNTLTVSNTQLTAGQQLILLSVVTGNGSRLPGGTVTFVAGGTVFGTATLNAQGIATLSVSPDQGSYGVTAVYSGDTLFAGSTSAVDNVVVAPTVAFTMKATPNTMTMASGQHGTLTVQLVTATTLNDTLAFGCAGLPASATCTFSQDTIAVKGGMSTSFTVTVDTGNPLGSGGVAQVETPASKSTLALACILPLGGLMLVLGRGKRFRRPLGLLTLLLLLGSVASLTGCAGLNTKDTPAGSYVFSIVGTGLTTGSSQSTAVQLTVTQ
ncbi:Ig-like domain (group 3) [Granulicella rosea]|uniref:Ig-like domain (Group 3) n=1 Tax=Granulicella rosea TaxID=474952 RepID=A0A239LYD8_9BACT|nr:Ig-like domain repeat protein [Granulicella rosea]SNT34982.1 Ig-like domain (group 3) [Granulicella rosea]